MTVAFKAIISTRVFEPIYWKRDTEDPYAVAVVRRTIVGRVP